MTDSRSERPQPTEPTDPQPTTSSRPAAPDGTADERPFVWASAQPVPAENEDKDDGQEDKDDGQGEDPSESSRGRGARMPLILVGALAVAGLLVWAITATLPNNSPKPNNVAAPAPAPTTASAVPTITRPSAPTITLPVAPSPPTTDVQIANSANGLVLDVDNSGTAAGTLVGTWSVDHTPAQHWHLVPQSDGSYVIYSELADLKKALEININTKDFGGDTITTLQPYTDVMTMQWTARYLGSNKYELVSGYNGQCLTGGGQGVANATSTCDPTNAHQAWTITG